MSVTATTLSWLGLPRRRGVRPQARLASTGHPESAVAELLFTRVDQLQNGSEIRDLLSVMVDAVTWTPTELPSGVRMNHRLLVVGNRAGAHR